jgi:squalene-hopene/tetraprenyl-beta-curcumene cyclase
MLALACVPELAAALASPALADAPPATASAQSGAQSSAAPSAAPRNALGALTDDAHDSIDQAIAWFVARQDASGGWSVPSKPGQPHLPAITALALNGMLLQPPEARTSLQPSIDRAVAYILSHQKPDGGIYDTILPSYNTAIAVSTLVRIDTPAAREAVTKAIAFLRQSQWGVTGGLGVGGVGGKEAPQAVPQSHAFYGGWGYGNRGRPDLSNTAFVLQAFHDAGVPSDDPVFVRALAFLQRCQMLETDSTGKVVNDRPFAKGSRQGGFIYATAENANPESLGEGNLGLGNSFAGTIEETMTDGTKVSRLRAYGSVSYLGFKSYIYAGLKADDPRVIALREFLSRHYTMTQNPGMGTDGQYYYYLMLSRAMDASGQEQVPVIDAAGRTTQRSWRRDLILQLLSLQQPDGSFMSLDDRWMENNPELITAYSLLALQHAARPPRSAKAPQP